MRQLEKAIGEAAFQKGIKTLYKEVLPWKCKLEMI